MAKLQSASIRLVLKRNRVQVDGTYPIYLVISFFGKKEKSTGVSVLEKHWDVVREQVRKGCPNAPVLNRMLNDLKQRVIDLKLKYELEGRRYTVDMLMSESFIEASDIHLSNDFRALMESLITDRHLKYKTVCKYRYAYGKLVEFMGRDSFIVDELTESVCKRYVHWLECNGISSGSIAQLLSIISSVWNYAILKELVDVKLFPFRSFKYGRQYKSGCRDYFIDVINMQKLKDYFLSLVVDIDGSRWSYKDGALDRLHRRYSKEFGILWFLMMYKFNGSAPVDVALLKVSDCSREVVDGIDYWKLSFHRRKTGTQVTCLLKRDIFSIICFEHFLGFSSNGYVYPIVTDTVIGDDRRVIRSIHKAAEGANKAVREAFQYINEQTIRSNVENGLNEPLVDINKVVLYTARHSLSNHLLSSKNVSVRELSSILSRSPNTISVYINSLLKNNEISKITENMAI